VEYHLEAPVGITPVTPRDREKPITITTVALLEAEKPITITTVTPGNFEKPMAMTTITPVNLEKPITTPTITRLEPITAVAVILPIIGPVRATSVLNLESVNIQQAENKESGFRALRTKVSTCLTNLRKKSKSLPRQRK